MNHPTPNGTQPGNKYHHPFFERTDLEPWQHHPFYEPHLLIEPWQQRQEWGKSLRLKTPREAHSHWQPALNRPDPIDLILATNEGRQDHLIPIRMGRMSASPFTFMRGTAAIMAWDLAHTPVSGIQVLVDGDAHLNNFGLYGTPQRTVVFDLDDFDEVTYGAWEWDLKRLAASVNVAGREQGLNQNTRRKAVMACVAGYRANAVRLQSLRVLEVWYLHHYPGQTTPVFKPDRKTRKVLEKAVKKAQSSTNVNLLNKLAHRTVGGNWRFSNDPPILKRTDEETAQKVIQGLISYAETLSPERRFMFQRYRVADVAHRIVGVGSVGLKAYIVMLLGNDDNDPLFLQVKEAVSSCFAPYTPSLPPAASHQGRRVVLGQRVLQAATDVLLGWTSIDGTPFYVRQMKNMKGSIPLEWLNGSAFVMYARACGTLLARAHARSGDIAKIAGYCGSSSVLDEAIADFAEAYGDQNQKDWEALVTAINDGRIVGEIGI
ncbi:DUF2252 domain-containing protein [Crocosphaera sp. XPORK-15E]|uniref:DUF2252 domain-containing protein n=1 Tax=Crocosphaera sp. XPORK-15E TaxID=3110247 RepID=UPI002B1F12C4|nr:DUF2252 domain-containing protein [Crocosphaera sp. XPORK-15E]MEA5534849.1 DUF2252 domain-containing protein [Crocosphaera sp. XPORK-15E]